ncbi:MAG TPA: hypothetical protein VJW20_20425 [Candidatus Angelobacter sp.]|nr:hypothetical protein [Candidatus Angelobacter sp.]
MITSGNSTYLFSLGTVFIVTVKAGACACGRITHLFKNRNGKTVCLGCEASSLMVAPTECDVTDDGPDAITAFQKGDCVRDG